MSRIRKRATLAVFWRWMSLRVRCFTISILFLFANTLNATPGAFTSKAVVVGVMEDGGYLGSEVIVLAGGPVVANAGVEYKRYNSESVANAYFGYGVWCGAFCYIQVGTGTESFFMRYSVTTEIMKTFNLQIVYEDFRDNDGFDSWQFGFVKFFQ